jgi:hypothetical protein
MLTLLLLLLLLTLGWLTPVFSTPLLLLCTHTRPPMCRQQ